MADTKSQSSTKFNTCLECTAHISTCHVLLLLLTVPMYGKLQPPSKDLLTVSQEHKPDSRTEELSAGHSFSTCLVPQ